MRNEITQEFLNFLVKTIPTIERIAILGGTSHDGEMGVIGNLYPEAEIHYFNLENPHQDVNFHQTNINFDIVGARYINCFDLVVSSQVLEHIWNHDNYFEMLKVLCKSGGVVWISCPKSNMTHGSPEYYSAGFTSSYLSENLKNKDFTILSSGELGNKRYYLGVHLGRHWQTQAENSHPILRYNFQPGTLKGLTWKFLRDLPSRLVLCMVSTSDTPGRDYATESYIAARKL
jgi:2-polyprenyl-3-methyl-5-hydroxy-6-metoxy-1,4-benzoquinol methylase